MRLDRIDSAVLQFKRFGVLVIFRVTFELLDQCRISMRQDVENNMDPPVIPVIAGGMQ